MILDRIIPARADNTPADMGESVGELMRGVLGDETVRALGSVAFESMTIEDLRERIRINDKKKYDIEIEQAAVQVALKKKLGTYVP